MRNLVIGTMALLTAVAWIGSSSVTAGSRVETTRIQTAEKIELATDIYHPVKEPAPVILIRTPYGRTGHDFLGEAFSARGYVVAIQDVRGRYDSSGDHEPFRHEQHDGLASLGWIARQPWCNGRIGVWGISYSGYAGLVLADSEIKQLASILSFSGWIEAEDIVRPGGAMHLMLDLPWMLTQQGNKQRQLGEFDIETLFRHTPLSDAMRAAGIRNSTWEDPTFLEVSAGQRPSGEVNRPILHVTGWNDMVYEASLRAWEQLTARTKAPQKLVVGPWYHDQMMIGEWEVGDAHFGPASGFGVDELIALSLRWFDATLKQEKNGFLQEPAVTYFLMDQNAWHTEASWPPAADRLQMQRWYLDSGGKANGSSGDGALSPVKPEQAEADRFVFDPHDPVPTLGGANFHFFPERIGIRDQRAIEQRKDVLVYTSAPLTEEIQITGKLEARLHVATSGKDTDFTAKLVVVRPDGYARIVEEGIARAGVLLDEVPPAGEPFVLTVAMGQTAIAVPAGHRLRVEISSSNFPKYDRNPNTGEDPFTARELRKAKQTVFHGAERASHIVLPVRRKPLVASARGRRPLIRPLVDDAAAPAKVAGNDTVALLAQGQAELDESQSEKAVATFARAAELQPDSSEVHYWLGRAYLAQLQDASMFKKLSLSKKTRAAYLKSIELDPQNLDARASLAAYYFNAPGVAGGSTEKGLEQVEEIRKQDARRAHMILAGMYSGKKKLAQAKQEYRAAIELDPSDADPYYLVGLICQEENQWDEAFEVFEKAVKRTDDMRSQYQIGRTGIFSGKRLDRAKEALLQYIARGPEGAGLPTEAHAHWRLGMIHEKQGHKDLARGEYQEALKLDPELEQAQEALENLG